ncbi:hypothetical protein SAMN05444166_4367 [Singulisphaera sp. GP187]|nr:hypothetical protein SAMN05444166_4367 [Singulisphaera sp. GP187]
MTSRPAFRVDIQGFATRRFPLGIRPSQECCVVVSLVPASEGLWPTR